MSLLVLAVIFSATLLADALAVLYQRLVIKEQHFKATLISTLLAGIGILIWKYCLSDHDSTPAIIAYLLGGSIGTYGAFKVRIDKPKS